VKHPQSCLRRPKTGHAIEHGTGLSPSDHLRNYNIFREIKNVVVSKTVIRYLYSPKSTWNRCMVINVHEGNPCLKRSQSLF
jgi:hypothetical protein